MGFKGYAAVLTIAMFAGAAHAQAIDPALGGPGDAAHGKALFAQRCAVCHKADKGEANGVGPALYGAFGRTAAQVPNFAYSPGLKASNIVWTQDKLNQWVQKPQSLVPDAKMHIPPVSAAQDRADIIAYLKTESDAPAAKKKG
jgi:cytochrome c